MAGAGVLALLQHGCADEDRDHADGGVDVEDGLPADVLYQQTADDGTERRGYGRDHGPYAHGHAEPTRWEDGAQQAQGVGHQQTPEEALCRPEDDDAVDGARQADRDRGESEPDDAHHVVGAPTEAVAELAAQDQGSRQGEQVGVGDPLEVRGGRLERAADLRVGDGDHGSVELDHEEAEGHRQECQPGIGATPPLTHRLRRAVSGLGRVIHGGGRHGSALSVESGAGAGNKRTRCAPAAEGGRSVPSPGRGRLRGHRESRARGGSRPGRGTAGSIRARDAGVAPANSARPLPNPGRPSHRR